MIGDGRYSWITLDGGLQHGTHWDDLPEKMDSIVAFVPNYPAPPHTQEEHDAMATFNDRLQEAMKRCRPFVE